MGTQIISVLAHNIYKFISLMWRWAGGTNPYASTYGDIYTRANLHFYTDTNSYSNSHAAITRSP